MKLLTKTIKEKLLRNGDVTNRGNDHKPVVKFFNPFAGSTWLITEMDSADDDTLFGLCDLGIGFPELGNVSLEELQRTRHIERDLYFKALKPLSHFTKVASQHERIIA